MRATEAAIGELIEERRSIAAEASRTALDRVAELEARVAALGQEAVKAERLATETELRAPVDGEVQQLAVHTVGGVVKPGETLDMPVVFYVDPAIVDAPELKNIQTITLSYTFFPVEKAAPVAADATGTTKISDDKLGG